MTPNTLAPSAHALSSGDTLLASLFQTPRTEVGSWSVDRRRRFGPSEFDRLLDALSRLRSEHEAPNERARQNAKRLIELFDLLSWRPNQVVHSAEGGFAFIFEANGRYADIECLNDGSVMAGLTDFGDANDAFEVELDPQEIESVRDRVQGFLGARRG